MFKKPSKAMRGDKHTHTDTRVRKKKSRREERQNLGRSSRVSIDEYQEDSILHLIALLSQSHGYELPEEAARVSSCVCRKHTLSACLWQAGAVRRE
jgi:hypothetical protein